MNFDFEIWIVDCIVIGNEIIQLKHNCFYGLRQDVLVMTADIREMCRIFSEYRQIL